MKAIFLYDLTGVMAAPWLEAGYECWRFDGQHPAGITRNGNDVTKAFLEYAAPLVGELPEMGRLI